MDIDDIMFNNKGLGNMATKKTTKNAAETTKDKITKNTTETTKDKTTKDTFGIGLDVGTGYLSSCGYVNGKLKWTPLRNAFYSIDKETFSKTMFNKQQMKYVVIKDIVNVIGDDALTLSRIQNTSAKRPLSCGVINNKEKSSAPVLKSMLEYCIKDHKKKDGEVCVFSIPGPKVGDESFDVDFHSMSIEGLLNSFNLKPVPLNEAYAVILSEMETSKDITGLGFSFGAGLVNVAFVYKSMLLFSFSIDKSGDFIDSKSADTCGVKDSLMNHLKEKELDLNASDMDITPELRTLKFTYKYVIKNTLKNVVSAFNRNDTANIVEPIPIVISGGTSIPDGFIDMFKSELSQIELPFEVTKIIPSSNRLGAVSKGCLVYAKELE